MSSRSQLQVLLADLPSLLVGYSGGVDSTLLAVVARRTLGRQRSIAGLGVSPSLSAAQYRQAVAVAQQFDLDLVEVRTGEVDDPRYVANAPDRCYFCKQELWNRLYAVAEERGIAAVADGTNADDLQEHRPGLRAASERNILTPLADAGYTKEHVRAEARDLGIPTWDAPAAPCLSSRIRYGLAVTPSRLQQVEQGEALLRSVGVSGDLRVRHRGDEARIEVAAEEFESVRRHRDALASGLVGLGFARVTLDLDGYRRGSQLESGDRRVEVLAEQL
jgi:uncharacterized protein